MQNTVFYNIYKRLYNDKQIHPPLITMQYVYMIFLEKRYEVSG